MQPSNLTPADLIAFERDIADAFNRGEIRAPIHLSGGCEHELIAYFRDHYDASRGDWICTTWRSHYHALLAGVPPQRLKQDILAGRSITLTYLDHRIISSAIVGGILPIALGLALSIKRAAATAYRESDVERARVHAFIGDMTQRTGIYHEVRQYAEGHALPLNLITEDNGKSVMTPTYEAWGKTTPTDREEPHEERIIYELPWPHAGAGKRVEF